MSDNPQGSVTGAWEALRQGDDEAVARLWERYFERLVQEARQRMGRMHRRVADEEDVAVSVFASLCRGVAEGRFKNVTDRGGLWGMLLTMTRRKVIDRYRHDRADVRGGGAVRGDSLLMHPGDPERGGFDGLPGDEADPEFLAVLEEEHRRLMALLPNDGLRQVTLWRMEGYENKEIAAELGITVRAVERKFQIVRETWTRALGGPNG